MRYQEMRVFVLNNEKRSAHMHQEMDLYYVLTGQMELTVNKEKRVFPKEAVFLVNANVSHGLEIDAKSIVAVFQVSQEFLAEITNNPFISFECDSDQGGSGPMEELRGLLKNMLRYHMSSGGPERLKEYSYYYLILWHLVKYYSTGDMLWNDETERGRLEEIIKYIQMNYSKQIGLQDLADRFYLSIPYLSLYIKEGLGMGFKDYLNKVRLERAVEELLNTSHSVTRIAFDNGFSNLASFNRVFRKTYQMTPTVFKKEMLKKRKGNGSGSAEAETGEENTVDSSELLRKYFENTPLLPAPEPGAGRHIAAYADAASASAYARNWMNVLNLGAAEELMHVNIQEHLLFLKKGLNYTYGRIWSLFCKENYIDIHTENAFNFSGLDQILDFMVGNGIIPFLDFGLKPKVIRSDAFDDLVLEERDHEFLNMDQYRRLLRDFMKHCVARYGAEQVETWKFELWWERRSSQKSMPAGQYEIFRAVYETVKSFVPAAQVGGFGFNIYDSNAAIENFLENMDEKDIRPDFISVYLYPYNIPRERHYGNEALVSDENFVEKELNQLRRILQTKGIGTDRLYITEWNMSVSSRNFLNDSCYKGAYIVKNILASIGKTACMAYWGSTDRTDEHFDSLGCLNGAPGLLSKDGIRKPSYFAFQFLNRLGKNFLCKEDNYIVTSTDFDEYDIVCHNYQNVDIGYYLRSSEKIDRQDSDSLFREDNLSIEFSIDHVKAGKYSIKTYYVNRQAGSVFDEWMRIGFSEILDREELAYLSSVSVPHLKSDVRDAAGGVLRYRTNLEANEIQLIRVSRISE